MGGNVKIDGLNRCEPIYPSERDDLFPVIHSLYEYLISQKIEEIPFSGSSSHLFNANITTDEIKNSQTSFSDVDVVIPVALKTYIEGRIEKTFTIYRSAKRSWAKRSWTIVGVKKHGNEISLVIQAMALGRLKQIQVDLEFKECNGLYPTEFSRFSQSSPVEDWRAGIKGVYHKQLLMALCSRTLRSDHVLYRRRGGKTEYVYEYNPPFTFSVAKGLRKTLTTNEDGDIVHQKPADATYITNLKVIADLLLNVNDPFEDHRDDLQSFHSICRFINGHFKTYELQDVCVEFFERILGKKNRVNRPEDEKRKVASKLCQLIPNLHRSPYVLQFVQDDSLGPQ